MKRDELLSNFRRKILICMHQLEVNIAGEEEERLHHIYNQVKTRLIFFSIKMKESKCFFFVCVERRLEKSRGEININETHRKKNNSNEIRKQVGCMHIAFILFASWRQFRKYTFRELSSIIKTRYNKGRHPVLRKHATISSRRSSPLSFSFALPLSPPFYFVAIIYFPPDAFRFNARDAAAVPQKCNRTQRQTE